MIAFAFQIYYDFAGYSRIARGLAYWMGYQFPQNFNHPYIAKSLQDFWRRWHISLSTWFRDYVYIPLGGSRKGSFRTHLNFWIVMLVSGLWHGAAWNFIIWGSVHALFYSIERETKWSQHLSRIPYLGIIISVLITNVMVLIAWVFFRSPSTDQAFYILETLFMGQISGPIPGPLVIWLTLAVLFEAVLVGVRPQPHASLRLAQNMAVAVLITGCVFLRGPGSEFIYFQF